ncbi:MAG: ATP-dependent helicase [Acholeplasmataceae bacterium]|nr:ATP-dependent helicase [Acholeplasmataceae bacterium]
MELNEEQKKVVYTKERFLFLLASAGSGKTRVIIERMKYLIENGVSPDKILAITFTKKSAIEMRNRAQNEDIHIHTFHQFCYQRLVDDLKISFQISDEEKLPFSKSELLSVTIYKNSIYKKKKPFIYDDYQAYLINHQLKDFDDLLLDYYQHIKKHKTNSFYAYIFIDEFQDTNDLQYVLLKELIHKNTSVLAVGDPDQSIYAFRGANSKIIYRFIKDYQAKLSLLSINYRSNKTITSLANRLIKRNNRKYIKEMKAYNKDESDVYHLHFLNEIEEAISLFKIINKLKATHINLEQMAILYRNNYRAFEMKKIFLENNVPIHNDNENINNLDSINMLTIHKAKGLEFDVVIIVGLEQGVLPSLLENSQDVLDEERRLMFVAMTRARKVLYFSSVEHLNQNHSFTYSRFIHESGVKTIKSKRLNDIISLGDFNGRKTKNSRINKNT